MKRLILGFYLALASTFVWAVDTTTGETPEIQFTSLQAADLSAQALNLGTPLYIYQYLRDNTEFALYHGSVSGSINSYGGMRGNDVDLASTFIAMLRARGTPSRYVVGTVTMSANQLMNWLGVQNVTLAASLLNDQGIQGVTVNAGGTVSFEHAWVEALVPYENYRGIRSEAKNTSCVTTPSACQWVPLDPSFKQKQYGSQNIDLHDTLAFDYTAYYNAIQSNDQTRLNKNPLEIYEDQTLAWLRTNLPGATLTDVENHGVIQPEDNGLLPASLPYAVTGTPRRYNSVADHDAQVPAVEPKKWAKYLNGTFKLVIGGLTIQTGIGGPFRLVDLATQRLTITLNTASSPQQVVVRLGGTIVATPLTMGGTINGQVIGVGTPFSIILNVDGPPATTAGGTDTTVNVNYQNLAAGGYYLISTGGETSNWSQVHRAAQQLLAANQQYPIVFNPTEVGCLPDGTNCTPYVDINNNGWDATDPSLSNTPAAMDALTGGLLYVAGTQYFTKLREKSQEISELNHTKTPITAYVGMVSSFGAPEYIAGTAFSILPGGLLIDMKGIDILGSWRINQPAAYSSKTFKLMGHIGSSLEHETWQELTGYDAVSTVRGIQMALASGSSLQDVVKNTTQNTLPAFYIATGFSSAPPAGFSYAPYTVFATQPATWSNATNNTAFDLMKSDINSTTSSLRQSSATYNYSSTGGLYGWTNCVAGQVASVNSYPSTVTLTGSTCDGTAFSGTPSTVLGVISSDWSNTIIPTNIGTSYFNFFDRVQGFVPTDYIYRSTTIPSNYHTTSLVANIRNTVSLQTGSQSAEFIIPSLLTMGSTYRFSVYILNGYDAAGNLNSSSYSIANASIVAGGGYVDGTQVLNPATAVTPSATQPAYNNAVFTSKNTIAQTNNDLVKTASTIDPVSTVTGNNFHDETDITIKGRGLNVALTRTYNSATSATALDRGLGYGWSHSYMMQLKSNDYGICPNCTSVQNPENGNSKTSSITYTDERGGDHNYLVNETTLAVTPPAGEFDQLMLNQGIATPGAALVASSGHYTLVFRNGTRYEFQNVNSCNLAASVNCTARLLHMDDAASNMLTFNYDASNRLSTVVDNIGTGRTVLTFGYDATSGRLFSITDLSARIWKYGYDTSGNLTSMTNPLNALIAYTYSGPHNLKDVVLPELRAGQHVTTTFSYYQNGKTFNYKDLLGDTETMDYDLFRRSTRVTDPRGGVRSYEYDQNGAMTRLTEPDGGVLLFSQNPDGLRYQKYDAVGYGTQYSYKSDRSFNTASDNFGQVTREQDALAQNIDRDYGLFDQTSHVLDKRGVNTYNDYYTATGAGGVIGKLQAVRIGSLTANGVNYGNVTLAQYSYNPDGTLATKTEYIDPANAAKTRVTTYTWINNGLNLGSLSISGSGQSVTVSYGYDPLGRKTSETLTRRANPVGGTVSLTTSYAYDALDRVILVTDPNGNQVQSIYDQNGKVSQVIAQFKKPDNTYETRTVSTRTYDQADRLSTQKDTYNNSTSYAYDAAGNVISVRDANGHVTQYQYDAMNRRIAAIDANGYQTQTVYDLAGHPVASINPLGKQVTTAYDALGRPIKITDALGHFTTLTYDQNSNLTCLTDANANAGLQPKNTFGCTLYKQYDEMNRPVLEVNAENGQTKYVYDLLGNVVSLTDPMLHTWSFAYDNLGRQIGMSDPNAKSQTYQLDEAGNPWQKTDRLGRSVNYTYDNLNRLTRADYLADASWETFSYDYHGDLTGVANSAGVSYGYGYDLIHRMLSKTDNRTAQSMRYVYDPVGNLKQKTAYTGDIINYQYDATNRLTAEQSHGYLQASYQYDGAGRLLTRTLSSGAQTAYAWDDANRLTQLSNNSASGAPVSQTSYSRDNLGNILSKSEGASLTSYSYDPLYRLLTATGPSALWNDVYSYDKVGNRLSLTRNTSAIFYTYDGANRLTQTRTGTATGPLQYALTYDFEGNLLTKTNGAALVLLNLTWDPKNRVTNLAANGKSDSFTYDPANYRVAKTDSLGNKTYLLQGEHLEAVYSGTNLQAKFLRGSVIDEVINAYQYDSSGNWVNTTYHHDAQTSVIGLSGHNGDVYNLTAYAPFGETEQEAGPIKNFLKYTGREQDQDSGLYYYRARYYDPTIGRFISEDPKGFAGSGVNWYAYTNNNPLNANDPTGLDTQITIGYTHTIAPGQYHQFVILTDTETGRQFATRGGPSAQGVMGSGGAVSESSAGGSLAGSSGYGSSGGFGFGQITAIARPFDSNFRDQPNMVATQEIGTISRSYADSVNNAIEFTNVTNGNAIPYWPLGPNSNSYATTFVQSIAGVRPASILSTPGSDMGTPSPNLSYQPSNLAPNLGQVATYGVGTNGVDDASNAAAGGFLLYPNKPNTNQMQSVYRK